MKNLTLCLGILLVSSIAIAETPKNPTGIDFSYAGFEAGKPIPSVPAVLVVKPTGHDDTWLLQSAIDHAGTLPMQKNGFRGAILLTAGRFLVSGHLQMNVGGVVLRGSVGTVITATGISRRTLIEVGGTGDSAIGNASAITDETVPAGATSFKAVSAATFSVGDNVVIRRPSTDVWIKDLGMIGAKGNYAAARLDWHAGSHDLVWNRTITAVDPATGTITIDAPITTALEAKYGGGSIAKVTTSTTQTHLGVENLTLDSAFDTTHNLKDEDHSWIAIELDHVQDSWVRKVTARHFADSTVFVGLDARRITITDSRFEAPVSEEGGYRRQAFVVYGQQVLVAHCHSELGMNDFAVGLLAAGPNVFLDDVATGSLEPSGPFEGWASGVLYENVHVSAGVQLILDVPPPNARAQGAGWTSANSVLWNVTGKIVAAKGPDGAPNFIIASAHPLYATELAARGLHLAGIPVPQSRAMAKIFAAPAPKPEVEAVLHPFSITNGRFMMDGKLAWGEAAGESWWKGDTSPATAEATTGSSVTKFKPGIVAPGETEDLTAFAARIKSRSSLFIEVKPGLWYDHRRDAHIITPQPSADVWAPFYEMPWARSGKGQGMDGLSLFDVSRYNPWYFERHREFAKLAAENGFIVYFDLYNDHNVLEIGPHWADFPWRPRNNINDTHLPEPPPYHPESLGKSLQTLDVGNEFFSVDYAPLRKLHHDYILHVLDELGDQPNVIFTAAYQFAGPIAFEQFFQDTVAEWEAQHHHHVRIALMTGKNTTDAILADPVRSRQIAVVDMRYWVYEPDGKLFAPDAGQNKAFRKVIQSTFPGYSDTPPPTTPELVYKQVREYRDRYPDIALVPMESGAGPMPLLMGGAAAQSTLRGFRPRGEGSDNPPTDAVIDKFIHEELSGDLMKLGPVDGWVDDGVHNWVLAGGAADPVLIDARSGSSFTLAKDLPSAAYRGMWFDPHTGEVKGDPIKISGATGTAITKPDDGEWLLLLKPGN